MWRDKKRKHSICTHFPEHRNCDICLRTKNTRVPCRRRDGRSITRAEKFVDLITADHKVLNEGCESRNYHRYAAVVQVLATQWNPCQTKTSQETEKNLRKLAETVAEAKGFLKRTSLEFGKSCEDLSWNHRTSTPYRSETNGIAERAFRRVKEGTSAVLLQSGLDDNWWSDSTDAIAICEMSKTSWQTGKLCVNEDLENLSKDQLFHSVHWWNTS